MIFSEKVSTRIDDFILGGVIRDESLIKIFENAADHHTASVTTGTVESGVSGTSWILVEWRVSVLRKITFRDELYISTWISNSSTITTINRCFELKDANGEVVAKAVANSVLYDMISGKILRLADEIMSVYHPEDADVFAEKPARLSKKVEYSVEAPVPLRRSDIDFNGHVHNTAYLNIVGELIPERFLSQRLSFMNLSYYHAVKYGEPTIIKGNYFEDGCRIDLYVDDKLCFAAQFKYTAD